MNWRFGLVLSLMLPALLPAVAGADPIPAPVEAMIRTAAASGDPAAFHATVDLARKAIPASANEITVLAAALDAEAARRHHDELANQGFFEGWKGQGQVGAGNSTGNTKSTSLALALGFTKQGLEWDHAINATADYQRDFGHETKARYFAGYQGNYRFADDFYALGLLSYENDRFSGFTSRISEAVGLGWHVLATPDMNLSLEAGPALRQTDYIALGSENSFAGRVAANYDWQILPSLKFTEQASFYGESRDSTFTSNTALTVALIGALSAQLSYLVQYESDPPLGLENTNTTSRLTLVYNF